MPTNVTIELIIGIPSAAVLYSVLHYGGAFSGGTKCSPKPTVDLDRAGAGSMTVPALAWATTNRYNESDALVVAGKPDWFRALKDGAAETESNQLARTPGNLDVEFVALNGASHAVRFFVEGPNPLLSLAPAINAEIVVGLRKTATGKIDYSIEGKHDGFPNYTLSINGTAVYFWDCVAKNEDPSALGPPMDQVISLGWKSL
ncbi:MAG: hypothetical protein EOO38_18760 [Cytophagaceae bacterium]|nr:MAG: hypothetical protein EOO38_18760 [Cytophagaceae bacterium]